MRSVLRSRRNAALIAFAVLACAGVGVAAAVDAGGSVRHKSYQDYRDPGPADTSCGPSVTVAGWTCAQP